MLKKLFNFWKNYKTIVYRILFTLFILIIFRMGSLITMPGVVWQGDQNSSGSQFLSLLSVLGGGVVSKLSFFALGISPFITASIIVQLLSNGLVPSITRLAKQGHKGQIKLNYLTKFLTVPIGYLQSFATIKALENSGLIVVSWSKTGYHDSLFYYFLCPIVLLSGTMITLFFADLISNKGIGQGVSVIIFTSILVSMAYQFESAGKTLFGNFQDGNFEKLQFLNFVRFFIYLSSVFLVFYFIIFLNNSERRLPIQQTGSGLRLENQKKSYLPIKLNPSGVIPVIFASTLISLLNSVSEIVKNKNPQNNYVLFTQKYLSFRAWRGIFFFALLVFLFTLVYAHIAINSENLAENFKKNGVYVAGVRPGDSTRKYITSIVARLSIFGAFYLSFLSIFSLLIAKLLFYEQNNSFAISGTSLLILIMVGENIVRQLIDLKVQSRYVTLWNKKKDIFLW